MTAHVCVHVAVVGCDFVLALGLVQERQTVLISLALALRRFTALATPGRVSSENAAEGVGLGQALAEGGGVHRAMDTALAGGYDFDIFLGFEGHAHAWRVREAV